MSSVLEAGFVFWGVFLVFFLVVVAYVVWMLRIEAREARDRHGESDEPRGGRPPEAGGRAP